MGSFALLEHLSLLPGNSMAESGLHTEVEKHRHLRTALSKTMKWWNWSLMPLDSSVHPLICTPIFVPLLWHLSAAQQGSVSSPQGFTTMHSQRPLSWTIMSTMQFTRCCQPTKPPKMMTCPVLVFTKDRWPPREHPISTGRAAAPSQQENIFSTGSRGTWHCSYSLQLYLE